ncbi:MAG: sigma-70 family RNA polymerase sigma factor [Phycisphaeraceae bacterium]|nr:sigma-70 family RNA polymerase sigma factor [Phycisphaeraceae bacterium]
MMPTEAMGRSGAFEIDESEFLQRLRAGEERAFDELTDLAAGRMLAVARKMMPNEADAEEAVQDAFLNAFKGLSAFDGRSKLTTWLHQITVNACLMKMRSKRRRPETSIESLLPAFQADGHQVRPSERWVEVDRSTLESSEIKSLIRAKMEELPEQYRAILMLRDISGLDTEETAQTLGVTLDTVRTRLHRARQALKTLLDPYFEERGAGR